MPISNLPTRVATVGLALGLLALWLVPAVAVDENRAPTPPPAVRLGTIASAELFRSIDQAVDDNLGLKGASVTLVGNTLVAVGISPSPRVIIAPGGEPYLADDFTATCFTQAVQDATTLDIANTKARLDAEGVYFLYAITPDKSTVERDNLGALYNFYGGCTDTNVDYLRSLGQSGLDGTAPVLTAFDEFDEAHANGETLFMRGDSHWNSTGAELFADLVLDRLARDGQAPAGLMQPGDVVVTDTVDHPDDLYLLMGVPHTEKVDLVAAQRDDVTTTYEVGPPNPDGWSTQHWTSSSTTGEPLITGRTLILHDSMFGYNGSIYAPYFEDLTALPVQAVGNPTEMAKLGDYDRVIVQQVQRTLPNALDLIAVSTWF